jgi:hypothetical protein
MAIAMTSTTDQHSLMVMSGFPPNVPPDWIVWRHRARSNSQNRQILEVTSEPDGLFEFSRSATVFAGLGRFATSSTSKLETGASQLCRLTAAE